MKKKKILSILMILAMLLWNAGISPSVIKAVVASANGTSFNWNKSNSAYDVKAVVNGGTQLPTTYDNVGYKVKFQVGSNSLNVSSKSNGGSTTVSDVKLTIKSVSNGVITYEIKNTKSSPKEYKLATYADIKLGSNDYAALYKNGTSGILLTQDNSAKTADYKAQVAIGFTPQVTTSWIGSRGDVNGNLFVDGTRTYYTKEDNVDTAVASSWQGTLSGNETKTFTATYETRVAALTSIKFGDTVINNVLVGGSVVTPDLPDSVGCAHEWNTAQDGSGISYGGGRAIIVTEENMELYHVKRPNTYTVNLDNQGATSAGTKKIYEIYDTKYSLAEGGSKMTPNSNPIDVPTKYSYQFCGYYTATDESGIEYINRNGYLTEDASTTNFIEEGTLYAKWLPLISWITVEGFSGDYDGEEKGLIINGDTTDCEKLYSLDGENWDPQMPKFTDAGEYTVHYKITKDGYVDLDGSALVSIKNKKVTEDKVEIHPESENIVYTGEEITPKVIIRDENSNIIPESEYRLEYENNVNIGTATIYVINNEGGNYTLPEGLKVTFRIIEEGKYVKPNTEDKNDYSAKLLDSIESLVEKIKFTDEEMAAREKDGKGISIYLDVKDISDSINADEKAKIEEALKAQQKLGLFLDVNLMKQVDGQEASKIESTSGNIKIVLKLPEKLINKDPKITRKFTVFALHDGKIKELVADCKGDEVIFETNEFSTYSLVYTDTEVVTGSDTNGIIDNLSNNPMTGDTGIVLWVSLMIMSALGILEILKLSKRKIIKE